MRTLAILAGLMLMIAGLIFMGLDLIAALEAHGILAASSTQDIWNSVSPDGTTMFIRQTCAPLPAFCPRVLHAGLSLYAWVIPGILGVVLIWLGAGGHPRRHP